MINLCWFFVLPSLLRLRRIVCDADCRTVTANYMIFRTAYNALATQAEQLKLCRFHMRPKIHQYEHLVLDFLPGNPRYSANFLNEDYIRRAKMLAVRSHPIWMAKQVLFRYTLQFCLKWRESYTVRGASQEQVSNGQAMHTS